MGISEQQVRETIAKPKNPSRFFDLEGTADTPTVPMHMLELWYSETYCSPTANPATGEAKKYKIGSWEQQVVSPQGAVALAIMAPAYSRVKAIIVNLDSAIVYSGGVAPVKIGIGTAATTTGISNLFLSGTATAKNTVFIVWPTEAGQALFNSAAATAATLYIGAANTSGSVDGNITGTIRVDVIFEWVDPPAPHP